MQNLFIKHNDCCNNSILIDNIRDMIKYWCKLDNFCNQFKVENTYSMYQLIIEDINKLNKQKFISNNIYYFNYGISINDKMILTKCSKSLRTESEAIIN